MISKYLPWLIALLYFISPYDLLPDFIFGPGWLDDLGVLALAWWWATKYRSTYQTRSGPWTGQTARQKASRANRQSEEEPYRDADPYEILGIESGASKADIKAAFKRLAFQYHPDKVQHLGKEFQELAHKKFIAIQNAYDVLMK